jgi:hypothetical protein
MGFLLDMKGSAASTGRAGSGSIDAKCGRKYFTSSVAGVNLFTR